ncbi:hypothetical protein LNM18_003928 [Salmonella enterica subsp. enterica serovar Ealing]|jgi:hypothetical protein|uniref:Lipoprotein n=1 Tax=Salmonella muenchen TaxID=596 RepID=A0A5W3ITP9_SALMU|nr:hypothetical protein [Salmonella enterica subsp. enterica serovar Monschaui]EBW6611860.1 hypothetical protein [Salmonella enterica subsp. enterica serovar Muenchen]ECB6235030.1 hypothetical protein [Salmonella enterica subsp. enterica serovar Minnesota]EIM5291250.1 hypothetical protein [Salmonella enterica subsp. enterica serovar Ealing]
MKKWIFIFTVSYLLSACDDAGRVDKSHDKSSGDTSISVEKPDNHQANFPEIDTSVPERAKSKG